MAEGAEDKRSTATAPADRATQKRQRLSHQQRRRQLIESAVRLIGSHGLQGTTVSKISASVGLSEMAAYRHFGSKDEILVEASTYLLGRIFAWLDSSTNPSVLERFKELGLSHFDRLSSDIDMFNSPNLQFITMTHGDGPLHRRIAENKTLLEAKIARLAEEGIAQGSLRADADPFLFMHEFIGWFLAEDVHCLSDLRDGAFSRSSHLRMLDLILRDVAALGYHPVAP